MVKDVEFVPSKIEHFIDTDLDDKSGGCSFYYNYLVYTFHLPAGSVTARAYLDEPEEISIFNTQQFNDLENSLIDVLAYLRARYSILKILGNDGYVEI